MKNEWEIVFELLARKTGGIAMTRRGSGQPLACWGWNRGRERESKTSLRIMGIHFLQSSRLYYKFPRFIVYCRTEARNTQTVWFIYLFCVKSKKNHKNIRKHNNQTPATGHDAVPGKASKRENWVKYERATHWLSIPNKFTKTRELEQQQQSHSLMEMLSPNKMLHFIEISTKCHPICATVV